MFSNFYFYGKQGGQVAAAPSLEYALHLEEFTGTKRKETEHKTADPSASLQGQGGPLQAAMDERQKSVLLSATCPLGFIDKGVKWEQDVLLQKMEHVK